MGGEGAGKKTCKSIFFSPPKNASLNYLMKPDIKFISVRNKIIIRLPSSLPTAYIGTAKQSAIFPLSRKNNFSRPTNCFGVFIDFILLTSYLTRNKLKNNFKKFSFCTLILLRSITTKIQIYLHILLENVCSSIHFHHSIYNEFTESCK